jgi:NAD(P)-dependent dehydrogenase (short-subunit alcohol dehydrogenase family)
MMSSARGILAGAVVIVTGASRGIGATTARALSDAGASVVLAARDERALAAVAEEISDSGGRALAVPTDVGDPASVCRLVEQTLGAYGRLDAAFNNAAGSPQSSFVTGATLTIDGGMTAGMPPPDRNEQPVTED